MRLPQSVASGEEGRGLDFHGRTARLPLASVVKMACKKAICIARHSGDFGNLSMCQHILHHLLRTRMNAPKRTYMCPMPLSGSYTLSTLQRSRGTIDWTVPPKRSSSQKPCRPGRCQRYTSDLQPSLSLSRELIMWPCLNACHACSMHVLAKPSS